MITEDYVSFEVAKILKEKGFDESTPITYFVGDDKPRRCAVGEMIYHKRLEEDTHLIACPTLQMVMKWLRETHHIDICVCRELDEYGKCFNGYIAVVYQNNCYKVTIRSAEEDLTYEEAANKAIKYGLTLIH